MSSFGLKLEKLLEVKELISSSFILLINILIFKKLIK